MKRFRLVPPVIASLVAIAVLTAPPATAGLVPGACSGRMLKWECVGIFTIAGPKETLRIYFHNNDNTVVEVVQAKGTQRMLVTPDGVWYQGVAANQGEARNPFIMLPGGALIPIKMLEMAFPDGPDTVPELESKREIQMGREHFSISAARAADRTVRFSIDDRGKLLGHGEFRAGELPPPIDGFDLTQWTRGEPPQMLRSNPLK